MLACVLLIVLHCRVQVAIHFGVNNNASVACAAANSSFFVEFLTEYGDLPLMQATVRNADNSFRLHRENGKAVNLSVVQLNDDQP